jgi:long-chain acyl-CoA synthetase
MLINEFLQNSVNIFPDKEALIFQNQRLTYQEIDKRTNQLAHALIEFGIDRGDRVAIYLPNSPETVIAIFAILKAGGVFLAINHITKTEKLRYILNNSQAKALVCSSYINNILFSPKYGLPLKIVISGEASLNYQYEFDHISFRDVFDHYPSFLPDSRNSEIDLAALLYTTGSTGYSKGVEVTHSNIFTAVSSISQYLENTRDDIIINTLPLSLDYGLYQVMMTFKMSATLILEHSFSYPLAIIDKIINEKVTGFPLVPKMAPIIQRLDNLRNYDFEHLRYISFTGTQLSPNDIMNLRKIFPKTKIYCLYGQTDGNLLSCSLSDQVDKAINSVAKDTTIEEVFLVNDKGERIGTGEIEELVVKESEVAKEYWELPDESNRISKPGC